MNFRKNFVVALAVAALLACAAPGYTTEILLNRSFETTGWSDTGVYTHNFGSPENLPNWTPVPYGGRGPDGDTNWGYVFVGYDADPWFDPKTNASDGVNFLNFLNDSCLEQTFPVTAGIQYTLSFDERLRQDEAEGAGLAWTLTPASGSLSGTTSGTAAALAADGWLPFSYTFTPDTTGDVTLNFVIDNWTTGGGVYLDNVSVSGVPEPSTLVLLAAGLAALLACAWKKRK